MLFNSFRIYPAKSRKETGGLKWAPAHLLHRLESMEDKPRLAERWKGEFPIRKLRAGLSSELGVWSVLNLVLRPPIMVLLKEFGNVVKL